MPLPAEAPGSPAVVLALTTEADGQRAEALAQALLEQRLAACISLTPITSLYHWQGALERSQEVQLLIKTSPNQLVALAEAVQRLHSYDTPQWLTWPASASASYGQWVAAS